MSFEIQSHEFYGLDDEEVRTECQIRNIDFTSDNWKKLLDDSLIKERSNPSIKPTKTHAKHIELELSFCVNQGDNLYKILNNVVRPLDSNQLEALRSKITHWCDRTFRLKGLLHQDNDVDKLLNRFRRIKLLWEWQNKNLNEREFSQITDLIDSIDSREINPSAGRSEDNVTALPQNLLNPTSYSGNNESSDLIFTRPIQQPSDVTWIGSQPTAFIQTNSERITHSDYTRPTETFQNRAHLTGPPNCTRMSPIQLPFIENTRFSNPYRPIYESPPPNLASNSFHSHHEPKWNISFSGTLQDLDVHDFIFRMESLARRENISINALDAILPKLLKDTAEKWYWVFTSKFPNASYMQIKQAMVQRFSSYESERETRRVIETRKQKYHEPINDFVLEIESLNSRINNRFSEPELLEIIRENISIELQQATLTTRITSVEELRLICQKYERLWKNNQYAKANYNVPNQRRTLTVNEINPSHYGHNSPINSMQYGYQNDLDNLSNQMDDNLCINAIQRSKPQQWQLPKPSAKLEISDNYLICWNCRDIGHRYQDCQLPPQGIFCYGCGMAGIIKPQCSNCNNITSGNALPGVNKSGVQHPVQILSRQRQSPPIPRPRMQQSPNQ